MTHKAPVSYLPQSPIFFAIDEQLKTSGFPEARAPGTKCLVKSPADDSVINWIQA